LHVTAHGGDVGRSQAAIPAGKSTLESLDARRAGAMGDRSPDAAGTEDAFDPRSRSVRSYDHTARDRLARFPLLQTTRRSGPKPGSLRASVCRRTDARNTRRPYSGEETRELGGDNQETMFSHIEIEDLTPRRRQ
jgi:hypothetical protein